MVARTTTISPKRQDPLFMPKYDNDPFFKCQPLLNLTGECFQKESCDKQNIQDLSGPLYETYYLRPYNFSNPLQRQYKSNIVNQVTIKRRKTT